MSKELIQMCIEVMWSAVQRNEWREPIAEGLEKLLEKWGDESETDTKLDAACGAETQDYRSHPAYRALTQRWGTAISIPKLEALAFCVAKMMDIPVPSRTERRKRSLLFCWFHRNWEVVEPLLPDINLEEEK
jgi:hypothetical protein